MTTVSEDQPPEGWSAGAASYDDVFAPFTGAFAEDAIERLHVGATDRVLDVAAGSGAFSLRAAALGATVLATDFAPGMLDVLAARAAREEVGRLATEVMDGQALALESNSFDVACSMFGLIFFPDMDAGLRELARVVRRGGRLGVSCWDLSGVRLIEIISPRRSCRGAGRPPARRHAALGTTRRPAHAGCGAHRRRVEGRDGAQLGAPAGHSRPGHVLP